MSFDQSMEVTQAGEAYQALINAQIDVANSVQGPDAEAAQAALQKAEKDLVNAERANNSLDKVPVSSKHLLATSEPVAEASFALELTGEPDAEVALSDRPDPVKINVVSAPPLEHTLPCVEHAYASPCVEYASPCPTVVSTGNNGNSRVHKAVRQGSLDQIVMLHDMGFSMLGKDASDRSTLHVAALQGSPEIVKFLLANGANPQSVDNAGRTATHVAAAAGRNDIIDELQNITVRDVDGRTPMSLAAEHGRVQTVKKLMSMGAAANDEDDTGNSAIHYAAASGHLEVVNLFVEKVKTTKPNARGQLPLHLASYHGYLAVVNLFIQNKNNVNVFDKEGNTPSHLAATNGHLDVLKVLFWKGADFTLPNKDGKVPDELACDKKVQKYCQKHKSGCVMCIRFFKS